MGWPSDKPEEEEDGYGPYTDFDEFCEVGATEFFSRERERQEASLRRRAADNGVTPEYQRYVDNTPG